MNDDERLRAYRAAEEADTRAAMRLVVWVVLAWVAAIMGTAWWLT